MWRGSPRQDPARRLGQTVTNRRGVVLVGFGAIGSAVARILDQRGHGGLIKAIALRDATRARTGLPQGVPVITDPGALAEIDAGMVVEVAGRDSVAPWGRAALSRGLTFAVSSTSALSDSALLAELVALAQAHATQLIIPPGALGGIDALAAASRMGLAEVHHTIIKPCAAWAGTEAERLCDLPNLTAATVFFHGPAADAATRFPQNANVALVVALAGLGPDKSQVSLVADPDARGNIHEISASGDFGQMSLRFENKALAENPKSSAMTALSVVRLIENFHGSLVL